MKDEQGRDYDKDTQLTSLRIGLDKVIGQLDPTGTKGALQSHVAKCWRTIAGQTVSEHTISVHLRKQELVVILDSPIWAQEIAMFSKQYIAKINAEIGSDSVTNIRYKVGRRKKP